MTILRSPLVRRYGLLILVLAGYACVAVRAPEIAARAAVRSGRTLLDVGLLLLAIYLFLGLFEEWISPARLSRVIGRKAGSLQALAIAFLFGAWGSGPVYVTYPIASLFLRSGARIATAVTFMSAWQVVKLTMLPFEVQFLGTRFALVRLAACALVPVPVGLATEALLRVFRAAPRVMSDSGNGSAQDALSDISQHLD